MKKRILYIHHAKGIGGAPLSLLYLIRGLDLNRYEPIIVCLHDSDAANLYRKEGWKVIAGLGVIDCSHSTVHWIRWYRPDRIVWRLWSLIKTTLWVAPRLFREQRPNLVHLNTTSLSGWGVAAKLMKIPVVCHVREPLADGYFGVRKILLKYLIHWFTTAFIPICYYDASKLVPSTKIHVVYNFVDFKQFDKDLDGSEIRRELGISPENKIVLFLGGLSFVKGILVLLLSAEFFLERNCSLLIAGNMRENISSSKRIILRILKYVKIKTFRVKVEEQITFLKNHYSENSVLLLGIRNDIPNLLASCDILIFPATAPHFARPVIEAAAMCKPAIASNTGGLRELIDHEHTGLLVDVGDSKSLGKAIHQLLDDPKRCRIMGEKAYCKAKSLFNSKKNCKMVMDIYENVLKP